MSTHRTRWSDEDRRAFTEQRLRAQTIPGKRQDGPEADEWDDECRHTITSSRGDLWTMHCLECGATFPR